MATLVVSNCEFDNNKAQAGGGAFIMFSSYPGTNGCGGGIYTVSDLRATNITVFANRALGGDGPFVTPALGSLVVVAPVKAAAFAYQPGWQ
jgi:hypothetical protein